MRKMPLVSGAIIAAVALSGCAKDMAYIRTDGQRTLTDPVLAQQFEIDRTICSGEMQKANVSGVTFSGGGLAGLAAQVERQQAVGQVGQGCMAQKGYALVERDKAEARLAEFAAVAAEKKRREVAEQEAQRQAALPRTIKKKKETTTAQSSAQ
jgi:hypothetical protein